MFLKKRKLFNPDTGDEMTLPGTTTTMSTIEFSELMEEVIRWGAMYLSIQIPYPNEELIIHNETAQNE